MGGIFLGGMGCIFGEYLEVELVDVVLGGEGVGLFFFALFDSVEEVHGLVDDFVGLLLVFVLHVSE